MDVENVFSVKLRQSYETMKSVAWRYFGNLDRDGNTIDAEHWYCSLCVEKNKLLPKYECFNCKMCLDILKMLF